MPPAPNPNDFAVVVGIDQYSPEIDPLRGCANDAGLFRDWLIDPAGGGLDPANVSVVRTPPTPFAPGDLLRPMKDDVEQATFGLLERALQTGMPLGRRLYLWFSGHGVTAQGDLMDCALLMANATRLFLGRSVPGRKAAEVFRRGAVFREVVLFMDCCREMAGLAEATLSVEFSVDPTASADVRWLYGFATRTAALAAERELPHPFDPAGGPSWQGVFAHAVLEGLRSGVEPDGRVTSASLAAYVKRRVPDLLPPRNNQRPEFEQSDDPIVFGAGNLTPVRVRLSRPADGLQIRTGEGLATVPASAVASDGGVLVVQLPPGLYLFATPQTGDAFRDAKLVRVILGEALDVVAL